MIWFFYCWTIPDFFFHFFFPLQFSINLSLIFRTGSVWVCFITVSFLFHSWFAFWLQSSFLTINNYILVQGYYYNWTSLIIFFLLDITIFCNIFFETERKTVMFERLVTLLLYFIVRSSTTFTSSPSFYYSKRIHNYTTIFSYNYASIVINE